MWVYFITKEVYSMSSWMTEALFISDVSPFSYNTFPSLATLLPMSKPASSPSLLSCWHPPVPVHGLETPPKEKAACSVAGSSGAHTEQAAPCCGSKGAGCCLAGRSSTSSLQLLLPWRHAFILLPSAQLPVFTKPLRFIALKIYSSASCGRNWLTNSVVVRMGQPEDEITLIFIGN